MQPLPIRTRRTKVTATNKAYLQLKMTPKFKKGLEDFALRFEEETGQTLTLAYLFREGVTMKRRQLERQLELAKKGAFHAKKRKPNAPSKVLKIAP